MATRRPKDAEASAPDNVIRVNFGSAPTTAGSFEKRGEVVSFPGAPAEAKPKRKRSKTKENAEDPVVAVEAEIARREARRDPRKLAAFTELIEQGLVTITFDPRAEGVAVPEQFATRPTLSLNFSHRFNIADFDYDEVGVRATLSFDTGDFRCELPWNAIYLLSSKAASKTFVAVGSFPPEAQRVLPSILRQLTPYERMD
jgi:hypothetical protein